QKSLSESQEKLILQCFGTLVRAQNLRFHFLQLGGDKSFAVYGRLFACVVGGHGAQIRIADLYKVSENGIEPDLQRLDSSPLDLSLLKRRDPIFAADRGTSQFIQCLIVPFSKHASLFEQGRWLLNQCRFQKLNEFRELGNP